MKKKRFVSWAVSGVGEFAVFSGGGLLPAESNNNKNTHNAACPGVSDFFCVDDGEFHDKPARAVPLESARQHPDNQKENRAGSAKDMKRFFRNGFPPWNFLWGELRNCA
jgi:hypothetical protein